MHFPWERENIRSYFYALSALETQGFSKFHMLEGDVLMVENVTSLDI